jgi:hypothetical protein
MASFGLMISNLFSNKNNNDRNGMEIDNIEYNIFQKKTILCLFFIYAKQHKATLYFEYYSSSHFFDRITEKPGSNTHKVETSILQFENLSSKYHQKY